MDPEVYEARRKAIEDTDDPALLAHIVRELERDLLPDEWAEWLRRFFPEYCYAPFAEYHQAFWSWVWSLQLRTPAQDQVNIWSRETAKSTSAELACVVVGARRTRRYVLYASGTQAQADDHVGNVGAMLESERFRDAYPDVADRHVGLYGRSRGWRRNRLRTASGLTIDAVGLDTGIRGRRIDADRPDLIILDDIDDLEDSAETTERKIDVLTKSVLPAGTDWTVILAVQNLVHADSIFARLADGRAEYLRGANVSGPVPAIRGLAVEDSPDGWKIVSGTPTWAGMGIEACERIIRRVTLASFRSEYQHEVTVRGGGIFDNITFAHCRPAECPDFVEVTVWVDPAITSKDGSDACAVQVDAWGSDGKLYRLRSWERISTPTMALRQALLWAYEYGARVVGVETDQGGDTWGSVWREALAELLKERPELRDLPQPEFAEEKAGAGFGSKAHRASQMVPMYERHRIVHVTENDPTLGEPETPASTHEILERALVRFPRSKPYDLTDASFWSWQYLSSLYGEDPSTETSVAGLRGMTLPDPVRGR